jgi:antirestriction protein ArdC
MSHHQRVQTVARTILTAFETGKIPAALAQVFIRRQGDLPIARWSWSNQLLAALAGHFDARGFRQWQEVGRSVKKGERAFHILGPKVRTLDEEDPETGESRAKKVCVGFFPIAVFGYSQTQGQPLHHREAELLESLPLIELARAWGLEVSVYAGQGARARGRYRSRQSIALGVHNWATWAHELTHAADDRLVGLKPGQHADQEIVAELGGAVLLECLGHSTASDLGGAWSYICHYAQNESEALRLANGLLERTSNAVALLLDSAHRLSDETQVPRRLDIPALHH